MVEEEEAGSAHDAALAHPLVSGVDDRVDHRLAEQEVAHPLGDDHVDRLGQRHVLHPPAQHLDHAAEAVRLGHRLGVLRHAGALDRKDAPRACLRRPRLLLFRRRPRRRDYLAFAAFTLCQATFVFCWS